MNFALQTFLNSVLATLAGDQGVPPADRCIPGSGLTELSGCNAMVSITNNCKTKTNNEDKLNCACDPALLEAYFNCENDVEICLQSHMLDFQFEQNIHDWHSICDSRVTKGATLTTPPPASITSTYDFGACDRLAGSCYTADYETNRCSDTWMPHSPISYASCACQKPIYSLFSECQYNGNISCKRTTAHESNIIGYRECSYFWTGSETLPSVDMTSFLSLAAWTSVFGDPSGHFPTGRATLPPQTSTPSAPFPTSSTPNAAFHSGRSS